MLTWVGSGVGYLRGFVSMHKQAVSNFFNATILDIEAYSEAEVADNVLADSVRNVTRGAIVEL